MGICVWEHSWSLKIAIANFYVTKRDCIRNLISLRRLKYLFATLCNFALWRMDSWVPALGLNNLSCIQFLERALELGAEIVLPWGYNSRVPLFTLCLEQLPSQWQASAAFCTACHQGRDLIAARHGFEAEGQTEPGHLTWFVENTRKFSNPLNTT